MAVRGHLASDEAVETCDEMCACESHVAAASQMDCRTVTVFQDAYVGTNGARKSSVYEAAENWDHDTEGGNAWDHPKVE